MAGLFNTLGGILFGLGIFSGTALILLAPFANSATIGLVIILGSVISSGPFFAVGEALQRLEKLESLQARLNDTSSAILETLQERGTK